MSGSGRITKLRLTVFKSYEGVELPLVGLNVLIGRNGSGKSNALDALEVLSRLARGEEVRDALDGNRHDSGPVRGGIEGCAPAGSDFFELGVTVEDDDGLHADLDVQVQVRPRVQIVHERLSAQVGRKEVDLLVTDEPDPDRSDISAAVWNSRRGRNPTLPFRSSHLLTSQLPLRLAGSTEAERTLLDVVAKVLGVLGGIFQLDPVPHLMRQYVPEQDYILRRTADNVSAALARLKHVDPPRYEQLVSVIKELPEHEVRSLDIGKGSARQMSDGMLRMLAITTALFTGGGGLVVDGLENSVHPSQAARLLRLVKETSVEQGFQVVITTHSPALLNALSGDDHQGVLLIDRRRGSGTSRARRLVDIPGYLGVLASQRLGDAVTAEGFAERLDAKPDYTDVNRLLGIG